MSVMSMGKKSKALVRPLGAGNSRAGAYRGELRSGEPGAAAHRPEKRNVPGVSVPAQPGITGPARPRAARQHPPARPRLWVVPDAAVPDAWPGQTSLGQTSVGQAWPPAMPPGQASPCPGRGWHPTG